MCLWVRERQAGLLGSLPALILGYKFSNKATVVIEQPPERDWIDEAFGIQILSTLCFKICISFKPVSGFISSFVFPHIRIFCKCKHQHWVLLFPKDETFPNTNSARNRKTGLKITFLLCKRNWNTSFLTFLFRVTLRLFSPHLYYLVQVCLP